MKAVSGFSKAFALLLTLAFLVATGCSGGQGGASSSNAYAWDGVEFTVKDVKDCTSVADDGGWGFSGKCVGVTLDLGEASMDMSVLESNIDAGNLKLAGKKPTDYASYTVDALTSAGQVKSIKGEVTVYFDMDPGYEPSMADLSIQG